MKTFLALLALFAALPRAAVAQSGEPSKAETKVIAPRSGPEKDAALKKYGGTKATEEAVANGVDWLVRHAEPGGGWKADTYPARCKGETPCTGIGGGHHGEPVPHSYNDAQTALCCMALLGHGIIPDPEGSETQQTLDRALLNLRNPHSAWGLALACEALSEAEVAEGKDRWGPTAKRLAEKLLSMKGEDGAWAYAGAFRGGGDVPYSAFVVQGLVAARDVGVEFPADLASGVDRYLSSLEEHKGRLAYLKNGRNFGYTPTRTNAHSGAAMRELLQAGTDTARHKLHLGCVAGDIPVWKLEWKEIKGQKFQVGNLSLYQWYYGTIASFQAGGSLWTSYFGAVKKELLAHQRKDGCAKGSWNNEGTYEIDVGGRVFSTSLAILMLEQPYRHRKLKK
ncbi:MAG: hypothetical protein HUU15_09485 [Candidatus Brocadiae bacterium]|nr:hypothetical protein [Candidatus Brocadiia bacterium]